MLTQPPWSAGSRLMACLATLCLSAVCIVSTSAHAVAQESLSESSIQAQQAQAELQKRIDDADDATQAALSRLREAERQAGRLERYNAELAPVLESRAERIDSQQRALDDVAVTREALPGEMRDMVEQLRQVVKADMPFLRDERLARVAGLETLLGQDELTADAKLERIFSAWRTELDYGRGMDQWNGPLTAGQAASDSAALAREVDYLRIGRVGWYYVTPDDSAGGVWSVADGDWQPLDADDIDEVRRGIRIAEDQSAPALLTLPSSVAIEDGESSAEVSSRGASSREASS